MTILPYVKVGQLSCQKNVFLRELQATVVSCVPSTVKAKKGQKADALFDVIFDDSVLFPEGGGQPCDYGTLCYGSECAEVKNVQRKGDQCIVSSPVRFEVGDSVLQQVDWERRLDHMQHHTGEHLLTSVVRRKSTLGLPLVCWTLTHPFCSIQVDVADIVNDPLSPYHQHVTKEKKISDEMIQIIQDTCNAEIAKHRSIYVESFDTREEYEEYAINSEGRVRSRSIPEDVSGPFRIITIKDMDSCTCCGTHLENLSQLHAMYLLHQEVKGTVVKIHFITGKRAEEYFGAMYRRERQIALTLGSRPEDFNTVLQERSKTAAQNDKKLKRWFVELAGLEAERMCKEYNEKAKSGHCPPVLVHRRDDMDLDYFSEFRIKMKSLGLEHVVFVAGWSGDAGKEAQGQVFIMGPDKNIVEAVADVAKSSLEGLKGGFSKYGFRGKGSLTEWQRMTEEMDKLVLPGGQPTDI